MEEAEARAWMAWSASSAEDEVYAAFVESVKLVWLSCGREEAEAAEEAAERRAANHKQATQWTQSVI
jgi:hypothetical protein